MSIAADMYEGGGAKGVSWPRIGTTVEGAIVAIRSKQLPKFGTQTPEVWEDGTAKMTPIVTVQTEVREDADDDGRRDIYLRGGAFTAFRAALREAYRSAPSDGDLVGATLKMRYASDQKSGKGQPRKVFLCRLTPRAAGVAGEAWDSEPESEADREPGEESDDIPF